LPPKKCIRMRVRQKPYKVASRSNPSPACHRKRNQIRGFFHVCSALNNRSRNNSSDCFSPRAHSAYGRRQAASCASSQASVASGSWTAVSQRALAASPRKSRPGPSKASLRHPASRFGPNTRAVAAKGCTAFARKQLALLYTLRDPRSLGPRTCRCISTCISPWSSGTDSESSPAFCSDGFALMNGVLGRGGSPD
jgi:hypothetical protein